MLKISKYLPKPWAELILPKMAAQEIDDLEQFITGELLVAQSKGIAIYPPLKSVFSAFKYCSPDQVRIVILGQDPYHGVHQAHGMAFSVPSTQKKIPPSLRNILKEVNDDIGYCQILVQGNGDLTAWAKQGVLLLNTVLTVREKSPLSHKGRGWELFTDTVIKEINKREHIIYLLWGNQARQKRTILNEKNNMILESVHPSPLSAHRGFFGCKHFSQANKYLRRYNFHEITW